MSLFSAAQGLFRTRPSDRPRPARRRAPGSRPDRHRLVAAWRLEGLETRTLLAAIRGLPGFSGQSLGRTDDGSSTAAVSLGFAANFFGKIHTAAFVNNNGNITFGGPLSAFAPYNLAFTGLPIIAPFFADVDTRDSASGVVTYGRDIVDGHKAFAVNYGFNPATNTFPGVGYYRLHTEKLNKFQVILIDRSDTGAGNFDVELNYDQIRWETGDSVGGSGGLGSSPQSAGRVGLSSGPGNSQMTWELPGSGTPGSFLDTNRATGLIHHGLNSPVLGRYVIRSRNGSINDPPTLDPIGDVSVPEGTPANVTFTAVARGASPGQTLTFSLDAGAPAGATIDPVTGVFTYTGTVADGPTRLPVTVRVADNGSNLNATQTFHIMGTNVAPTATLGTSGPISEGTAATVRFGGVSDSSGADTAAGFRYSFALSPDGLATSYVTAGADATAGLAFTDNGTYTVSGRVFDKDGGFTDSTTGVTVTNVAPTVRAGADQSAGEGFPTSFHLGSFSDPGVDDSPWAVDIDWGDGSTPTALTTGGQGTLPEQSHTYATSGTYTVRVTVTDKDGDVGRASSQTITVISSQGRPAAVIVGAPERSPEGKAIRLTASATHPDPIIAAESFTFTWSVTQGGIDYASGTSTSTSPGFTFTPNDNADYVVTVTATDFVGRISDPDSKTILVTNVVPTASIRGDTTGVRGQSRRVHFSAADPSDVDAVGFTFSVDWGDGSSAQVVTPGQLPTLGHAYAATGTYTVTVRATDKDGGRSAAATLPITIKAVDLQADPFDPDKTVLVVGGTVGKDSITVNPGGRDKIKVVINGTSSVVSSPTGRMIVYGQAGNDNIQVAGAITLPALLFGGDGNDLLTGGNGLNNLVGGRGNDTLTGGKCRDFLIGGPGEDRLNGNSGDDILIAGYTAYDDDPQALCRILDEWSDEGLGVEQRIHHLRSGGGRNGVFLLDETTVFDDGACDTLTGSSSEDWFLANLARDIITDLSRAKADYALDITSM